LNARTFLLVLAIAATSATHDIARAEGLEAQQKALEVIANFADRICNIVSTKGDANSSEAKTNVTAQLSGLAAKLADIGVSASGSINNQAYQNVLRQDLAATLKDSAACKLKVFEELKSKLLETGPAYPAPAPQPAPALAPPVPQPAPGEQKGSVPLDGIDVVYFKKDRDDGIVEKALSRTGIGARVMASSTYLGYDFTPDKTDTLACTRGISVAAIKKVALALLNNGIELRGISVMDANYANITSRLTIESTNNSARPLTRSEIEKLSECPDQHDVVYGNKRKRID